MMLVIATAAFVKLSQLGGNFTTLCIGTKPQAAAPKHVHASHCE